MPTVKVLRDGVVVEQEVPETDPVERDARRQSIDDRRRARTTISASTFLGRFSDDQYAAIMNAANEQLAVGQPQLARWIEQVRADGVVYPYGEQAQLAKAMLVGASLLTQEQADGIFV